MRPLIFLFGCFGLLQSFQSPTPLEIKRCKASHQEDTCWKVKNGNATNPSDGWEFNKDTFEEHWIELELQHESTVQSIAIVTGLLRDFEKITTFKIEVANKNWVSYVFFISVLSILSLIETENGSLWLTMI